MSRTEKGALRALLRSPAPPSAEQLLRFEAWLRRKHGENIAIDWEADSSISGGFSLSVGSEVYDWTTEGRMKQLGETIHSLAAQDDKLLPLIRQTIDSWKPEVLSKEQGTVISVGDGISKVHGLARTLNYAALGDTYVGSEKNR